MATPKNTRLTEIELTEAEILDAILNPPVEPEKPFDINAHIEGLTDQELFDEVYTSLRPIFEELKADGFSAEFDDLDWVKKHIRQFIGMNRNQYYEVGITRRKPSEVDELCFELYCREQATEYRQRYDRKARKALREYQKADFERMVESDRAARGLEPKSVEPKSVEPNEENMFETENTMNTESTNTAVKVNQLPEGITMVYTTDDKGRNIPTYFYNKQIVGFTVEEAINGKALIDKTAESKAVGKTTKATKATKATKEVTKTTATKPKDIELSTEELAEAQAEKTAADTDDDDEPEELRFFFQLFEAGMTKIRSISDITLFVSDDDSLGIDGIGFATAKPLEIIGKGYTPDAHRPFKIYRIDEYYNQKVLDCLASFRSKKIANFWRGYEDGGMFAKRLKRLPIAKDAKLLTNRISLMENGSMGYKGVPKLSRYSEEIQSINPLDMLGVLPEAEAKVLMLTIGRMLVGNSVNPSANRPADNIECPELSYHWRNACVLHGEPGLGKSKIIEAVTIGMAICGYSSTTTSESFNNFAFAGHISKDLIIYDDLNVPNLQRMMNSGIKSVISGGLTSDEGKGKDARGAYPKATIIAACNEMILPTDIDRGIVDRFSFMKTRTKEECAALAIEKGHPIKTYEYWEYLKQQHQTTDSVLITYLFRRCVDAFLKEVGCYEDSIYSIKQRTENNHIVDTIKDLKGQFRFQVQASVNEVIPVLIRKSEALTWFCLDVLGLAAEEKERLRRYNNEITGNHIYHMASTITKIEKEIDALSLTLRTNKTLSDTDKEIYQNRKETLVELSKWFDWELVSLSSMKTCVATYQTKVNSRQELHIELGAQLTPDFIWEMTNGQLRRVDGDLVPKTRQTYYGVFQEKSDLRTYTNEIKGILGKCRKATKQWLRTALTTDFVTM